MSSAAPVNRRVVKVIQNFFKSDVCMIFEYDTDRDALVLVASGESGRQQLGNLTFRTGEGIAGSSYKLRSIINISNSEDHPGFKYVPAAAEAGFQARLAVPLVTSGRKIGVMLLMRRQEKPFTGEDVSLARSLAPQLANLIVSSGVLRNLKARTAGVVKSKRRYSSKLAGIPVSPGVVYGIAMKYKTRDIIAESEHSTVACVEDELKLLDAAIEMTRENTLEFEKRALTLLSEADASIFNAHLLFLDDKMVIDSIRRDIGEHGHTVEFSVAMVYKRFEKKFIQLEDNAFRERLIDFKDVMLRLIESARSLRRKKRSSSRRKSKAGKVILVAHELMPSDLLKMSFDNVVGIVCETGGLTSHVAILAKAFEIPALLGVKGAVHRIAADDKLVVDAHSGILYVNPDAKLSDHYDAVINGSDEETDDLAETVTTDGVKIELKANISLLCETPLLKKYHADGIGLYRTEFMFMLRDYLPDEDIQYEVYHKVFSAADGGITVRVLDAGSDKQINCLNIPRSVNPALGPRGTRVLLENPEFFQTHLRAILRAGETGRLKILFPMVTTLKEIRHVKLILNDVVNELERDRISFCRDYQIGVMLEVPSVFLSLDSFLQEVDFISVGTNDLLQYSYAIDRLQNENEFADSTLEPGFLRMLGETARKVNASSGKFLTVCGEIASHPLAVPVLLGGGVGSFSLPPKLIPRIRRVISHFSTDECREYYRKAVEMSVAEEVMMMMSRALAAKGIEKYAAALACW